MDNKVSRSIIWSPCEKRVRDSQMFHFQEHVAEKWNLSLGGYHDLYRWSVDFPERFWEELLDFFPIQYTGENLANKGELTFLDYPWFPHVQLNFAQNLLAHGQEDRVAINSQHESGLLEKITYGDLRVRVAKWQGQLKQVVGEDDVVACYMPNIAETVIAMLATSGLGGIFTSTSCDFGVQGVVDRFRQTEPKVLVTASGYSYNGKYFDLSQKIVSIVAQIPSLEQVILVDFLGKGASLPIPKAVNLEEVMKRDEEHPIFLPRNFSAPLYIMYSSGTTGKPKCIVHSVGGTLLQHVKELGLHSDLTGEKNIMYFTTCGWMMWNWLVSALFFGAEITLYEGAPHISSLREFIQIIDREKIHLFGTSPKFLRFLQDKVGLHLGSSFDSLETILSTGAPLLIDQFEYVYKAFKQNLLLGSICGGTDIIGCFMLGNPTLPVRRGEIQAPGLGMNIAALDEEGKPLFDRQGELVCQTPFISQPIGLWKDSQKVKFSQAYFNVFPGVWHHGDFITLTEHLGVMVHGRSDTTLNPGGVRIGTAEIYRQTESIPYIEDSVCVGQNFEGDVRVLLLVKLKEGEELSGKRIQEIKDRIRQNTTPRHVPEVIRQVADIPYTRSGKKMEMAVGRVINKQELSNREAMVNPQCLEEYRNLGDHLFLKKG